MANHFLIAGGNGLWNGAGNWSTTSGGASNGSFPVAGDVVAFNSSSGNANMTVNVASACASLVMSGTYAGTLTFNSTLTTTSTITFLSTCTIAGTAGTLIITSFAQQLTSGGKTLTCGLTFSANSTSHTLLDNWVVNGLVSYGSTATQGLDGVGKTLTCNGGFRGTNLVGPSGTAKLIFAGGTWDSTSTGAVQSNVDIAGNVTISGTVSYNTNTLKYVSGTIITTGSTLNSNASCTLNTAGITWNHVSLGGSSQTYTLSSDLNGTGTLTLNPTTAMTFAGTGTVNWAGALTFATSATYTIATNWVVNGLVTAGTTSANTIINGTSKTLTCNGGFRHAGVTSNAVQGTAKLVLAGGTWDATGNGSLQNSMDFAGNVTVSGAVAWGISGATLTYVSGTITTTGSTLTLPSACTLNTSGLTWANLTFNSAAAYSLSSDLAWSGTLAISLNPTFSGAGAINGSGAVTISGASVVTLNNTGGLVTTGTLTLPGNNAVTFTGSSGFSVGTLTTTALTASRIYTLTFGNTYRVTTSLTNVGATAAIRQAIKSSSPGNKVVFTVSPGAAISLAYCDPTDVDSSGGRTIVTSGGTITTSLNWATSLFTATSALTIGHVAFAGTDTFVTPTFTATTALTTGHTALASTATFTKPTYTATSVLTSGHTALSATALFTKPTYTANATLTAGHTSFVGISTSAGIFTANAILTVGHTSLTATALFTKPIYAATAAIISGVVTFTSTANFIAGGNTATATLVSSGVILHSIATFVPSYFTAAAGLVVGSVEFGSTVVTVFAPGIPLPWVGLTNLLIRWKDGYQYGGMRQHRFPIRVDTPQRLEYTFKEDDGTITDLASFLSVRLLVKVQGNVFSNTVASFLNRTTGEVFYDGFQFPRAGEWSAQFIATNVINDLFYGKPVRLTVVVNANELGINELPRY